MWVLAAWAKYIGRVTPAWGGRSQLKSYPPLSRTNQIGKSVFGERRVRFPNSRIHTYVLCTMLASMTASIIS